jgi:hypothetical protein
MFRPAFQRAARLYKAAKRNAGGYDDGPQPPENAKARVTQVLQIGGAYIVLITLGIIYSRSGSKKLKPVPAIAAVSIDSGDIPSTDSPEFAAWFEKPGNFEKIFEV